ncbi:MAG: DUF3471 domain-containing protein [Gemmatimonadetes bacterium]|nr:DUF3471 domain-containing protein [Gemmatimonadota bacterium]
MTNADQGGAVAAELSRRIQLAYEWDSFAEPAPRGYAPPVQRTEISVPAAVLQNYIGEYQAPPEASIVVTLENGSLYGQPTGQEKLRLFAEAEDRFFLRAVNIQISFTRNESGEVDGLVVHQGGREQRARKLK